MFYSVQGFQGLESLMDALGTKKQVNKENQADPVWQGNTFNSEAFSKLLLQAAEDPDLNIKNREELQGLVKSKRKFSEAAILLHSLISASKEAIFSGNQDGLIDFEPGADPIDGLFDDKIVEESENPLKKMLSESEKANPSGILLTSTEMYMFKRSIEGEGSIFTGAEGEKNQGKVAELLNLLLREPDNKAFGSDKKQESLFKIFSQVDGNPDEIKNSLRSIVDQIFGVHDDGGEGRLTNSGEKVSYSIQRPSISADSNSQNSQGDAFSAGLLEKTGNRSKNETPTPGQEYPQNPFSSIKFSSSKTENSRDPLNPENSSLAAISKAFEHQTGGKLNQESGFSDTAIENPSGLFNDESAKNISPDQGKIDAVSDILKKPGDGMQIEGTFDKASSQSFDGSRLSSIVDAGSNSNIFANDALNGKINENFSVVNFKANHAAQFFESDSNRAESNIVNQIFVRLFSGVRQGSGKMVINLHPPELGRVKVRISADKGGLKVYMHPQNEQVGGLLEKYLPILHQALDNQGILLSDLRVNVESGDQQMSQFDEQGFGSSDNSALPDSPEKHPEPFFSDDYQDGDGLTKTGSANGLSVRV